MSDNKGIFISVPPGGASESSGGSALVTQASSTISFSGAGTTDDPLTANLLISTKADNHLLIKPQDGGVTSETYPSKGTLRYVFPGSLQTRDIAFIYQNLNTEAVASIAWSDGGDNIALVNLMDIPFPENWPDTYRIRLILVGTSYLNNVLKFAAELGVLITMPEGGKIPAEDVVIPFPPSGEEYIYDVYPFHGPSIARVIGGAEEAAAGIPEAPIDGEQHARQDGEWTPVTAASIGAVPFFGQIPASANLNSLIEQGYWFNPDNATATLELNYPSNFAGSLQILKGAGVTQIYTEFEVANNSRPRQFRRGFYTFSDLADEVWGGWAQVYDSNNPPPATGGGGADGLDHDWTAIPAGLNSWSNYSSFYARKNGIVTIVGGGSRKGAVDTTPFIKLPAWAIPEVEIRASACSESGTATMIKVTTTGDVVLAYTSSTLNNKLIYFSLSYVGAPPAAL